MTEDWKYIEGFEGIYMVSTHGRVKSVPRKTDNNHFVNEKIIKLRKYEYFRLTIRHKWPNKIHSFLVHRLVAKAFIPNPEGKKFINHKDGNKHNNHVDNLEWCTRSENALHAYKIGLMVGMKGSNQPNSQITEADVVLIRKATGTPKDIALRFGVNRNVIYSVLNRKTWRHVL